jgi:hypothetical protein
MAHARRRNPQPMSAPPSFPASPFAARPGLRHPMLRIVLGLAGLLLLALLFVSVFVGIAMLAAGMLWRLWARRGRPLARTTGATRANSIDGDFRVVGKAQLPMAR